ncbi:MAG: hypothetical protein Q7R33_03695, partial [Nitrosarchaeum sp.]|nr:hypothetical protein [Nitrosarchaeum sp.]
NGDDSEKYKDQLAILEKRFDDKLGEAYKEQMQMFKEEWSKQVEKFYEGRIKENTINAEIQTRELEQELDAIESKNMKQKDMMSELNNLAMAKGKSVLELMIDLLKESTNNYNSCNQTSNNK